MVLSDSRSSLRFLSEILRFIAVLASILTFISLLLWLRGTSLWFFEYSNFEPLAAILTLVATTFWGGAKFFDRSLKQTEKSKNLFDKTQRYRSQILKLVNQDVQVSSLHDLALIEIGVQEEANAIENLRALTLEMYSGKKRLLVQHAKIINIFDETAGTLLILGASGSGKTTLLRQLARDLLIRAEQDKKQPIPIVLNLAAWKGTEKAVEDLLECELASLYMINKQVINSWIDNDQLVLLLDGLDEVKKEHQGDCINAINSFHQKHGLSPIVVCSRTAEYNAINQKLNFRGAVSLQPLTPSQIFTYIEKAGKKFAALKEALKTDSTLRKLAQTPLMLNIIIAAYDDIPNETSASLKSIEHWRKILFDTYVQKMLERPRGNQRPNGAHRYSKEQSRKWLTRLAQKMYLHSQSIFLIERIQPSWLQAGFWQFRVGAGLGTIIFFLLLYLPLFLARNFFLEGLLIFLGIGLIVAIFIAGDNIETVERLEWSWRKGVAIAVLMLQGFVFFAAFIQLWTWVLIKLGYWPSVIILYASFLQICASIFPKTPRIWSARIASAIFLFFFYLIIKDWLLSTLPPKLTLDAAVENFDSIVIMGFFLSSFGLLIGGIRSKALNTKTTPNQGIRQSAINAILVTLTVMRSPLHYWFYG